MLGVRKAIITAATAATAAMLMIGNASVSFAQSAELRALDAQLPGKLINDPTRIDWEVYGNEVSSDPVIDKSIPGGGAALRVDIRRADAYIYTAGLNIPLTDSISGGDQVTVGFYARTIEARTDDNMGVIRVRFQQNFTPYPGFGEETLSIGNEWQWYEVTAKAEFALRQKDGIIAIQFGRTKQVLEFGQLIVVKGAASIAGKPKSVAQPVAQPAAQPADLPAPSIPNSLEGLGTLLNDPTKADWYFESNAGDYMTLGDTVIFGTPATRFTVAKADSAPHDAFITVPLGAAIAQGDELLIAVAARNISPDNETGEATVKLRIEDAAPPYAGFADNEITLSSAWRLIRANTKAAQDMAAGQGQLAVHLGGQVKTVDIGPIFVIKKN